MRVNKKMINDGFPLILKRMRRVFFFLGCYWLWKYNIILFRLVHFSFYLIREEKSFSLSLSLLIMR
jgi:hypothetical protein